MGRDVGYTTMIFRSYSPAPRPINYWEVMNHLKLDSETISNAKIAFSTVCKGREGRFKPVGSERGIPERQPELWLGWGGVFVQPTKGTLSSSRGQQVKYSLSLPHAYHSKIVFLTNTQSYDKNKSIFFFWGKLACITRNTSNLYQAGFPKHLGAAEIPMQIYSLALFQVVFLHALGGKKLDIQHY